jgi:hypothetical protein
VERHRQLSRKDEQMANRLGGSDIKIWHEYYQQDQLGYCEKVAHFMRSLYWRQMLKEQRKARKIIKTF